MWHVVFVLAFQKKIKCILKHVFLQYYAMKLENLYLLIIYLNNIHGFNTWVLSRKTSFFGWHTLPCLCPWKWLFFKFLIYHILMFITLKKSFMIWSSHGPQTYLNHMESKCLVDIRNFIKIKIHLNQFLSIFAFKKMMWYIYIWHKYISTSHHMN